MFKIFEKHIQPGGVLIFTSGPEAGEEWGENGGENLYHASLDSLEYEALLSTHHFKLLAHKIKDESCGGATVWVAKAE